MQRILGLLALTGLFVLPAFVQSQGASRTEDEQALRRIELETAQFEQRNDASKLGALSDDWVCLINGRRVLSKTEFRQHMKHNFEAHDNGPSPYTIEKKNLRVDLFGNTAVVTYIKEYRQISDATNFFDEDYTDVFTRSFGGWHLRLTKVSPVPPQPASN